MKTIEIRRHSIRSKPGDHLSQEGVTLARQVGETIGPFEYVITSTLPRAFETAIAMGFAVDKQLDLMNTYGPEAESEISWPQSFAVYARAVRRGKGAAWYGNKLADYYANLASALSENGAVLVINHGGVVELGVVAAFPEADYESWGDFADYCEGARLFWQDGKFVNAEVLRVSG
ncbi:MAG TPA: histidine phosphatase family protein [Anaerolineales bacterium]|nr:histidine phosphatase family protein [Anaerolineales bacterium]